MSEIEFLDLRRKSQVIPKGHEYPKGTSTQMAQVARLQGESHLRERGFAKIYNAEAGNSSRSATAHELIRGS